MKLFDRVMPVAFLACVALTACNDPAHDGYPTTPAVAKVEAVAAPTPAPQPATAVEKARELAAQTRGATDGGLKKSSLIVPKSPKVIWV
ncbi:hypothetical protein DSM104443_00245 [Usitatibacter rugosus]|uniref:Lipoprotein n=1 Tax=Usitatibacter rugosus TaxID=2732067 RepID=A0A6M4GR03_9PROT|nr:hypothetical protein [Usitatibacter rugosus]QJR09208.1 hypothetical protein DSM104443_00245 [Usitatibacter rugosus]